MVGLRAVRRWGRDGHAEPYDLRPAAAVGRACFEVGGAYTSVAVLMAKSRAQVTLKLLGLLALPVSVVALLFGFGVSLGAKHRLSILRFEKAIGFESPLLAELEARGDAPWWKVRNPSVAKAAAEGAKPGAPPSGAATPEAKPTGTGTTPAKPDAAASPSQPAIPTTAPTTDVPGASPTSPTGVTSPPAAGESPASGQGTGSAPAVNTPATNTPGANTPAVITPAEPVEPPLVITTDPVPEAYADALARIRVVRVKVVVDDGYRGAHGAWMDDAQRLLGDASAVYEAHFGLRFDLVALSRWDVADGGLDSDALLEDLRGESRDGADVLIGITGRPLDRGEIDGKAEAPTSRDEVNGAHLVLYASGPDGRPQLRSLLHELGHLYGADDVLDPASDAWKKGSWMSYAPAREGASPWIDPKSRELVLQRKFLPFIAPRKSGGSK